ncbi:carboxymuconolactone decarboxylase family protein [Mycobacterium servetii]|uniref:Carboxymuconolactone decarboxylase family protein n=1 Tax=Mycobacterium servetii TaxID=3237418 RepID=A0ABV4C6U4_9MYCO
MTAPAGRGRIPSTTRLRDLGLVNWVAARVMARTVRAPEMHLFTTLGRHRRLLWFWMPYSGALLRGRLPRADAELVILRVGHVRGCEYELQHHRRMGRQAGLDAATQAAIFAWPQAADGAATLDARQVALLRATDEFLTARTLTGATWQQLACHLDQRQLIEFCLLASQYDGLAATIITLDIPLDNPRPR